MNMVLTSGVWVVLLLIYISIVYWIDLLVKYQNCLTSLDDNEVIDFKISY
jgi:hypothetical protein